MVFNQRLIGLIQRDYTRMNLQLLKGVIGQPGVKQKLKGDGSDFEDELPIALEE